MMLFHLRSKKGGVKNFESMAILRNSRYSHGPSLNNGTKKKDPDKTGYKGLGFKAVFGKSNQVIIYSDGDYFRFDSSYQLRWNRDWGTNDQQTWKKRNDRKFIYP